MAWSRSRDATVAARPMSRSSCYQYVYQALHMTWIENLPAHASQTPDQGVLAAAEVDFRLRALEVLVGRAVEKLVERGVEVMMAKATGAMAKAVVGEVMELEAMVMLAEVAMALVATAARLVGRLVDYAAVLEAKEAAHSRSLL